MAAMESIATPAQEWQDVDAEQFANVIKPRGRPAILRGVVKGWPATLKGRDSPQAMSAYLKSFYNGHPVPVFEAPPSIGGRFFYNEGLDGFNFESKRAPLGEVLDRLTSTLGDTESPYLYAGSVSLPVYLPGFMAQNPIKNLLGTPSMLESIWIGNRSVIPAHFDNTENLACVVSGKRRFTMFPPGEIANLYVGPLDKTPAGQPVSLVDIRAPDQARFPRYAEALKKAVVAELNPGDAVYVPALWWHHVEGLADFNVLVNFWWRDVADYFDSPSSTLLHALLTIKSLPEAERARWRELFDYLIFQTQGPSLEHLPKHVQGLFGELTAEKSERIRALLIKNLSRKV